MASPRRPAEQLFLLDGPSLRPGAWPWGELRPSAYGLIMADPPWRFEHYSERGEAKSPQAKYRTMTLDEIAALPVAELAAPDCLLWLWTTAAGILAQAPVAERWGFRIATTGVWVKRTRATDKLGFGTGYVLRNAHEPFVIATRGAPDLSRAVRSVVEGRLGRHSEKPDEAFAAAERLCPGVARLELFARRRRSGWDAWGDEVEEGT